VSDFRNEITVNTMIRAAACSEIEARSAKGKLSPIDCSTLSDANAWREDASNDLKNRFR